MNPGPSPHGKLPGAAVLGAMVLLQACSGNRPASPEAAAPPDAEITAYLQQRARTLHPDSPGLTLTDFRFSPDRKVVCGVLRIPGRQSQVFASVDATPATLDRPIGLPYVAGGETSETDRLARQRALNDEVCERSGLLPDTGE